MSYECPIKPGCTILVEKKWYRKNYKATFLGVFVIGEDIWFALKGINKRKGRIWFVGAGCLYSMILLDDNIELKKVEAVMTT